MCEPAYLSGATIKRVSNKNEENIIIGAVDGCCRRRIAHDSEHIVFRYYNKTLEYPVINLLFQQYLPIDEFWFWQIWIFESIVIHMNP